MATTASDPIVILSYARTPMGSFQGALSRRQRDRARRHRGQGRGRARGHHRRAGRQGVHGQRAARRPRPGAGAPGGARRRPSPLGRGGDRSTRCAARACRRRSSRTTCSTAGSADVIVAGGMESMTNAPYLSKKYRSGARIGHDTVYDHMMLDGLEDAYEPGRAMGTFAEEAAQRISVHPRGQDDYAIESLRRANEAITQRQVREGDRRR